MQLARRLKGTKEDIKERESKAEWNEMPPTFLLLLLILTLLLLPLDLLKKLS